MFDPNVDTSTPNLFSCGRSRERDFDNLPVSLPRGSHPFPSRTRKLSLVGPMVLHAEVCGRLGDRRHKSGKPTLRSGLFCVWTDMGLSRRRWIGPSALRN